MSDWPSPHPEIDDVARALTALPAPSLERAVLRRIGRQRPTTVAPVWPALVALGAMLVLVVTHHPPARPVDRTSRVLAQADPVSPTGRTPVVGLRLVHPSEVRSGGALPTSDRPQLLVPALANPESLSVGSIQPTALAVPQLTVPPLVVPTIGEDINRDR